MPSDYGYGYWEYGKSSYGSIPSLGGIIYSNVSGYGATPYGQSSYGNIEPSATIAISEVAPVSGSQTQVVFSGLIVNSVALNIGNYEFTDLAGVPVEGVSVSPLSSSGGSCLSVTLTHSLTTFGGIYTITLKNVPDPSLGTINITSLPYFAQETKPLLSILSVGDNTVEITSTQPFLTDTLGLLETVSYATDTTYPVPLTVSDVTLETPNTILLDTLGMTSVEYDLIINPSVIFSGNGSEIIDQVDFFGTGTTVVAGSELLVSKNSGAFFGWSVTDNQVYSTSSFDATLEIDFEGAGFTPIPTTATVASYTVSDGTVEVSVLFGFNSLGQQALFLDGGTLQVSVPFSWRSGGVHTFGLRKNARASLITLYVDQVPLISADSALIDAPASIDAGSIVTLTDNYAVLNLKVYSQTTFVSSTIFTESWNPIFGAVLPFTGSPASTISEFSVDHGPIVKDWGDNTPAEIPDIEVRVNGVQVDVSALNPYAGIIQTAIPIPTGAGAVVEVDYAWLDNPILPIASLNTLGLTLNQWSDNSRRTNRRNEIPVERVYPFSAVLQIPTDHKPLKTTYRYLGFEKEYTAALNSPLSLRLNQDQRARFQRRPQTYTGSANGVVYPTQEGWENPEGSGTLQGDGTIAVKQGQFTASYDEPTAVLATVNARMLGLADFTGLDSGISFGFHANKQAFVVGFLSLNGLLHVGMLQGSDRSAVSSWALGLQASFDVLDKTRIRARGEVQFGLQAGSRFQVLSGHQTGVYTVKCLEMTTQGLILTLSSPLPTHPSVPSAERLTAVFELNWKNLHTYVLTVNTATNTATLFAEQSQPILQVSRGVPLQDSGFTLSTSSQGQVFWGSTAATSRWSLVSYGIRPLATTVETETVFIHSEMSDLPENQCWSRTDPYRNHPQLDVNQLSFDTVIPSVPDLAGYQRLEPFLSVRQKYAELGVLFHNTWGSSGFGNSLFAFESLGKRIEVSTLSIETDGTSNWLAAQPFERLLPATVVNWTLTNLSFLTRPSSLIFQKTATTPAGSAVISLDLSDPHTSSDRELIFQASFSNVTCTGDLGVLAAVRVFDGVSTRLLGLSFFGTPDLLVVKKALGSITSPLNWDDGTLRLFRVFTDGPSFTVEVDGSAVISGTLADLPVTTESSSTVSFSTLITSNAAKVEIHTLIGGAYSANPLRTLGILKGSDRSNILHWEIPTSSGAEFPNDSANRVFVPMDWTSPVEARVVFDPSWGASLFRPDLPAPSPSTDFSTQITQPAQAWVNVETARLPRATQTGIVQFGSKTSQTIGTTVWDYVRFRLTSESPLYDRQFVLNRYNVLHSGEFGIDRTPEIVVIESSSPRLVLFSVANMYADRVFRVTVGGSVLPTDQWAFHPDTQSITFVSDLSGSHVPVEIVFAPKKPVTVSYLENQPFDSSNHSLFNDTPPFVLSQIGSQTGSTAAGFGVDDLAACLSGVDLNNPKAEKIFQNVTESIYQDVELLTQTNAGTLDLLKIADDSLVGLAIEGSGYSEYPVISGDTETLTGGFIVGGGFAIGSTLGGSQSPIEPVTSAPLLPYPMNSSFVTMFLSYSSVSSGALEETVLMPIDSDHAEYPPYYTVIPSVSGPLTGACLIMLEEGSQDFSRLGPYGGLESLEQTSLLFGSSAVQPSGIPASGTGLILAGGVELPVGTVTVQVVG